MFKTAYTAMMQNIAPAETTCQQVLAAMRAEESRQMPVILPVKQKENHRPVWTLVACAAMVTVAVALTWALMKGEKPPVMPATPPTTGIETTVTSTTEISTSTSVSTTITTTTTVDNGIIPSSGFDTTAPTGSTTVAVTTPPTSVRPSANTSTVDSTTATLPAVDNYDELFQWIQSFTSQAFKDDTFPTMPSTVSPTESPTTQSSTTKPPATSPSDEFEEAEPSTAPTAGNPPYSTTSRIPTTATNGTLITTSPTTSPTTPSTVPSGYKGYEDMFDWIHSPAPFGGGVLHEEKTTSDNVQLGDQVIGRLEDNTVKLAMLDSANPQYISATKPPLINNAVVKEFCLYGDRMVLFCGSEFVRDTDRTRVFVYDISDPAAPRLLQEFGQDGYYLTAHRVEDTLYILSYYVPKTGITPKNPATFIPRSYPQGRPTLLRPDQIVAVDHPTCNGYTVLTAISLAGQPAQTGSAALFGQNNSYTSIFENSLLIGSKPYAVSPSTSKEAGQATDLVQVTLKDGAIHISARITLKGEAPLCHFTGEYYYVLLTESRPDGKHPWDVTDRHIYVLDRQLKTVGKLEHFWEGNPGRLTFTDDALYGMDSQHMRYTLDLRDPTKPTLTPRKEMDWGTYFLHTLENGRLLTVQYASSAIVSIMDDQWNYLYQTESSSNFIGEPQEGLLVFLKRVYTYNAATGFTVEAETDFHPHTRDCLATDRTLYLIELDRITVYDRTNNYQFIGEL